MATPASGIAISWRVRHLQFALSGWASCPTHNHIEKILVQIKGATA